MYNHVPANYLCPFCALLRGITHPDVYSIQSDIVYHDSAVTAFLGSHQWPNNHGNVLVVPNEHFENLYDLPERYATDMHRATKKVALALKAVYACEGISTRQHNEPAGSQDVWHYHVHVTPRYTNDQFYGSQRQFMPESQRATHAAKIREYLTHAN